MCYTVDGDSQQGEPHLVSLHSTELALGFLKHHFELIGDLSLDENGVGTSRHVSWSFSSSWWSTDDIFHSQSGYLFPFWREQLLTRGNGVGQSRCRLLSLRTLYPSQFK